MKKIKKLIALVGKMSVIFGSSLLLFNYADKVLRTCMNRISKVERYNAILNQLLKLKNDGLSINDYFVKNSYIHIAIYGYTSIGHRLYEDIVKHNGLDVVCFIDKNAESIKSDVHVYTPAEKISNVDIIVVTPVYEYEKIKKLLLKTNNSEIISIEDIIYEM